MRSTTQIQHDKLMLLMEEINKDLSKQKCFQQGRLQGILDTVALIGDSSLALAVKEKFFENSPQGKEGVK